LSRWIGLTWWIWAAIVAPDPAQDWDWHPPFTVTGRLRPKGPMMTIEEFSYARARARVPVKITMPSPLVIYSVVTGAFPPGLL
jgi:hypothetical protein